MATCKGKGKPTLEERRRRTLALGAIVGEFPALVKALHRAGRRDARMECDPTYGKAQGEPRHRWGILCAEFTYKGRTCRLWRERWNARHCGALRLDIDGAFACYVGPSSYNYSYSREHRNEMVSHMGDRGNLPIYPWRDATARVMAHLRSL